MEGSQCMRGCVHVCAPCVPPSVILQTYLQTSLGFARLLRGSSLRSDATKEAGRCIHGAVLFKEGC